VSGGPIKLLTHDHISGWPLWGPRGRSPSLGGRTRTSSSCVSVAGWSSRTWRRSAHCSRSSSSQLVMTRSSRAPLGWSCLGAQTSCAMPPAVSAARGRFCRMSAATAGGAAARFQGLDRPLSDLTLPQGLPQGDF
jgi:hypothetical protein